MMTALPKGLLREHSQILAIILRGLDIFAIILAGYFAYLFKFSNINLSYQYMAALGIAAIVTSLVFSLFHIYDSIRIVNFWRYTSKLIQALSLVLILLAGLAFLTKTGESFSRSWFITWASFSLLLLLLLRSSLLLILRWMRSHGFNERRILIIGKDKLGQRLAAIVQDALWTGLRIVDSLSSELEPIEIKKYLSAKPHLIDEIWLALPLQAEKKIKNILHELRHETITIRFILDIDEKEWGVPHSAIAELAGFPVINIRTTPMVGMNRLIKALEDRILSAIILLCISPLLLAIAIAIKCSSRGDIFYRQQRVSWNGKEFTMLKFRSMPVDAEEKTGPVWAASGEKRATRIGEFLRKTSLDELPQFINVLRGDMSIVGPRPERRIFVNQFKEQIPGYMQKHLVKAGITGWAQVNGWRGNTSLEKRIECDLYYIQHWSLWFDIKIIFLTFFKGFIHKNAY